MDVIDNYRQILARYSDTPDQRDKAFTELLTRAGPILEGMHNQERLRPPSFNIFFALGHAYREVSTHSAMLAYLLDPAAGHAQGTLFLCKFLDIVRRAAEDQGRHLPIPLPQDGSRWQCRKEVSLPQGWGRADILLRGPGLLLVIENKIRAADLENQLHGYWEFVYREAQAHRLLPIVVYLTPDGHAPTDRSIRGNPDLTKALVRLSYRDDVFELVQLTADEIGAVSVAEVLRQYATLVRRLA